MASRSGARSIARNGLRATLGGAIVLAAFAAPAVAASPGAGLSATSSPTSSASLGYVSNSLSWRLPSYAYDKRVAGTLIYDVVDAATGRTVAARYAKIPAMLASSYKLITAVVALRVMSADTRFATDVVQLPVDPRHPSYLRIALVGGGDGLLGSADLARMFKPIAALAKQQSATAVQVFIDDSLFAKPSLPKGWLPQYQLAEVAPVEALQRDGRRSFDTSDEVGKWFTTQLRTVGLKTVYGGRSTASGGAQPVAEFAGHTLGQLLHSMLMNSDNDIAEHVARLAAIADGEPPTWSGWQRTVGLELSNLGISTAGMHLYDGSGLSRADLVAPTVLVTLLRRALDSTHYPELSHLVVDAPGDLPVAGLTGTLAARFTDSYSKCARGLVRAKTGFLTGVGSLTGLAKGVDGRLRLFTLIVNGQPPKTNPVPTRAALDDLAATIQGCPFAGN